MAVTAHWLTDSFDPNGRLSEVPDWADLAEHTGPEAIMRISRSACNRLLRDTVPVARASAMRVEYLARLKEWGHTEEILYWQLRHLCNLIDALAGFDPGCLMQEGALDHAMALATVTRWTLTRPSA
eukprot:CAMPEP_0172892392 /NCGR_PEP_ID=MMETSP1075-20121228/146117_1 /TAXON_ID=2916 /ORGANISM="Ceratium fusus, Strain PA161109" /LENGTH=125 /DNA_ID=CAMNT_0013747037 /DNA_START=53 /DNA_END=430 /DNA_ORIENTATION=-